MKVGLLIGTALPDGKHSNPEPVETDLGLTSSGIWEMRSHCCTYLIIHRHGVPPTIPPHEVNHGANLMALKENGIEALLSICSCGALRSEIPVPSLAVPYDYIDLFSGATVIHDEIRHVKPGFDADLIKKVSDACSTVDIETVNGGVYVQTSGPRFETVSEVKMLSNWGDFVGMNLGPEASISREMEIPMAGLLTVDNHANGIVDLPDYGVIRSESRSKWSLLEEVLMDLGRSLG